MISTDYKDKKLNVGSNIRVKSTIIEGGKSRVQSFDGILIAIQGRGENRTITVRRIGARGVGVERIWPLNAKSIVDIEVKKSPQRIRRSKLYYLRNLTGKLATRV